jgi:hypothetical protein
VSADELRLLAEEQAALRRVATLVARGAAPEEVFAAVVEVVVRLLPVDSAGMGRYEADGTVAVVASWGRAGPVVWPVGTRMMLGGKNLSTIVLETGRPAQIDSYADASGMLGLITRKGGVRSAVGTPIIVEGSLWGVIVVGSTLEQPLPADTEARLADFTELWRLRSRMPRPAPGSPGSPRSRRRCGESRRWWRGGRRRTGCLRRSPRRSGSCFRSTSRSWAATRPTRGGTTLLIEIPLG